MMSLTKCYPQPQSSEERFAMGCKDCLLGGAAVGKSLQFLPTWVSQLVFEYPHDGLLGFLQGSNPKGKETEAARS